MVTQPVMAFGDSLTWGWGGGSTGYSADDGAEGNSYPRQLASLSGWNVANEGIAGDLATGGSGHDLVANGTVRFKNRMSDSPPPGTVVVLIGINDLAAGVTATQMVGAYNQMIVASASAGVNMFLATIPPAGWSSTDSREVYRQQVNNWIRQVHGQAGAIDAEGALSGIDRLHIYPPYVSNGQSLNPQHGYPHLSSVGYAILAQAVYEGLNSPAIPLPHITY